VTSPTRRAQPRHVFVVGIVAALFTAGCSGKSAAADPATVVKQAKTTLDAADTVRVQLTSKGAAATLRSAKGEIKRPDGFVGTLGASVAGISVDVPAVSDGGHFYAKLPLSLSYTAIDPSTLGFNDPATLLNPTTGLSTLLTAATSLENGKSVRVGGEVADTITGQLSAAQVTKLLPLHGTAAVQATFEIIAKTHQPRQIVLTGNFATATALTTYTLTLDDYGAAVTITLPSS
jgi:lipoprotein LprG